jgi:hypothetical protein
MRAEVSGAGLDEDLEVLGGDVIRADVKPQDLVG